MEWNFLLVILTCVRFHSKWINCIKECISIVSFSMVINGKPFDFFNPSRDLRQGNPLSSVLVIIGSEVLSRLITREKQLGNIKGINIGKNGPYITYLLIVDNLIIFGTASVLNAKSFLNCLDK